MRALTVRQPWADLIMDGFKDVENRTWPVPSTIPCAKCRWPATSVNACVGGEACDRFPFRLGIHAAKQVDWPTVRSWPFDRFSDYPARSGDNPNSTIVYYRMGDHRWDDRPRLGVLLGFVTVTGCHHADECDLAPPPPRRQAPHEAYGVTRWCSRWSEPDVYHWTLTGPKPLDVPVPMRGRQGLWRLPDDTVADALTRQDQFDSGAYV